ncbi:hypothetical protein SRHO_G00163110 [Serrasalmus rhombeus]
MECNEEMYPAVRPKQQTRRPTRLQDFELDYGGYSERNQTQRGPPTLTTERGVVPAWEGLESVTPFHIAQPHHSSLYGAARHKILQLASSPPPRRDLEGKAVSEPAPSYLVSRDLHACEEIRAIQEENTRLLQSQQALQAGIKELNEARSEIKELIAVACSLQVEMSQCNNPVPAYSSHKPPQVRTVVPESFASKVEPKEGEEDWADPPAWPEPEENLDKGILKLDKQVISDSQVCSPPDDSVPLSWRLPTVTQQYSLGPVIAPSQGASPHAQRFCLQIQSLVGLLQTLGPDGEIELNCGSHVARLLCKLASEQRAENLRQQSKQPGATHNLYNLSEWLRYESWCQSFDSPAIGRSSKERQNPRMDSRPERQTVTVLHGAGEPSETTLQPRKRGSMKGNAKSKAYYTYCESTEHYFSQCSGVTKLSKDQLKEWIQANKRCWPCARAHLAPQCTLKKPCNLCQGTHLLAVHGLNTRTGESHVNVTAKEESCLTNSTSESFYLD